MGCDIHVHVECQRYLSRGEHDWQSFASLGFEPRDYALFGAMTAGEVRSDTTLAGAVAPRGYPSDADDDANEDYYEGEEYWRRETRVPNLDWHTPSWLTTAEFVAAVEHVGDVDYYWRAIATVMQSLEASGHPARVVFWFDN